MTKGLSSHKPHAMLQAYYPIINHMPWSHCAANHIMRATQVRLASTLLMVTAQCCHLLQATIVSKPNWSCTPPVLCNPSSLWLQSAQAMLPARMKAGTMAGKQAQDPTLHKSNLRPPPFVGPIWALQGENLNFQFWGFELDLQGGAANWTYAMWGSLGLLISFLGFTVRNHAIEEVCLLVLVLMWVKFQRLNSEKCFLWLKFYRQSPEKCSYVAQAPEAHAFSLVLNF